MPWIYRRRGHLSTLETPGCFDSVKVAAHLRMLVDPAISGTNLSLFDQCQARLRQWEHLLPLDHTQS